MDAIFWEPLPNITTIYDQVGTFCKTNEYIMYYAKSLEVSALVLPLVSFQGFDKFVDPIYYYVYQFLSKPSFA